MKEIYVLVVEAECNVHQGIFFFYFLVLKMVCCLIHSYPDNKLAELYHSISNK